ncbi:MAG: methionine synthase I (cobalamin-dependent) [Gammaproteobacteria bacterium]|jgi:methionine synthase I (cobalamin-dependent)
MSLTSIPAQSDHIKRSGTTLPIASQQPGSLNNINTNSIQNLFERLLSEKDVLLTDGATGTNLFEMGLQSGDAPEFWNIEQPEKISAHYRSFIDAGSDIILTNTFGGTRYRLKLHKAEERVDELNTAAVQLLKNEIAKVDRDIIIAGSIGPTGEILAPLGEMQPEGAIAAFAEQASALKEAGAHVLWIETMSSREEVELAVEGCRKTGLPIVVTLSFDTNGKTMMGVGAADLMSLNQQVNPKLHACGTNCGVGASEVVAAVRNMKTADADSNTHIIAKANCGVPKFVDGKIRYTGTPEIMATYAVMVRDAGAKIIGGCCGTTAIHVAAMRKALDTIPRGEAPSFEQIGELLGEISKGAVAESRGEAAPQPRNSGRRRRRTH